MKYLFLFLLIPLLIFGQVSNADLNINLDLTAPEVLTNQMVSINMYIETVDHGTAYKLFQGIKLAELNALNLTVQPQQPVNSLPVTVNFTIPANGQDLIVGALPLDENGREIEGMVTTTERGHLATGISTPIELPYIPLINDTYYYMKVTVTIQ